VPILTISALPVFWDTPLDTGGKFPGTSSGDGYVHYRDYPYWVLDLGHTGTFPTTESVDNFSYGIGMQWYDSTKALKKLATGETSNLPATTLENYPALRDYAWVRDGSGDGSRQPMKFDVTWQGWSLRERARPTAYIFEGPYAEEVASRMLIAGIDVKRLAKDTTVNVTGWHYAARPSVNFRDSGGTGWGANNRQVNFFDIPNRQFKKDTFVVFLGQVMTNLIPMYMEPDLPFSAGNGIMLTYMSVALGGASSGSLAQELVGMEMPIYRYIGNVDALETYDMDFFLPLINRGAVPRFFSFHTPEEVAGIEAIIREYNIKVFDYDIQVHARAGNRTTAPALKDGKFDMLLPSNSKNSKYMIQKKDGSYEALATQANKMLGWNAATIDVSRYGQAPFTVDLDVNGRPVVGDGSNRTLPRALPTWDDLIGVRIIEVMENEILALFKDKKLPSGTILTKKGIEYADILQGTSVLLKESMLDGWSIVSVTPRSGKDWTVSVVNGEVVVKFKGDAYGEKIVVALEKDGEKQDLEITFFGEKDSLDGCNAGAATLALFALFPLFMRRK
jgi:Synergist-CTERM protein sorting domain-containing protein